MRAEVGSEGGKSEVGAGDREGGRGIEKEGGEGGKFLEIGRRYRGGWKR